MIEQYLKVYIETEEGLQKFINADLEHGSHKVYKISKPLALPNLETFQFELSYTPSERKVLIDIYHEENPWISMAGFVHHENEDNLVLNFYTPKGILISSIIGPADED